MAIRPGSPPSDRAVRSSDEPGDDQGDGPAGSAVPPFCPAPAREATPAPQTNPPPHTNPAPQTNASSQTDPWPAARAGSAIAPADSPEASGPASPATDLAVRTVSLGKRYGTFDALHDCSLSIERNAIFGLLGPNGAGKSTLLRLLMGFLRPTSGQGLVFGIDPVRDGVAARRSVSYLPGDARLPRHMTGRGVLRFFADLHPAGDLGRSLAAAERLDLDLRRRVAFMSTGMRQKLALSVVFGPRTPLLILDEPTANLDPTVRGEVLAMVTEARAEGRTVILSSHVLSEIEDTCQRVAFLRGGRLAHQLRMADLFQRHRVTGKSRRRAIEIPEALADRVRVSRLDAPSNPSRHGDHPPATDPATIDPAVSRPGRGDGGDASREGRWCIDTAGDLAPLLNWLASQELYQVRVEPLGLRAVYDAVHFGHEVAV